MSIRKMLTSTAMFHTPGLFRALQNDYRMKGKSRQRAIHILSNGYGIPIEEAQDLLSGSIAVDVNDDAGTIAYEISDGATRTSTLSKTQA